MLPDFSVYHTLEVRPITGYLSHERSEMGVRDIHVHTLNIKQV